MQISRIAWRTRTSSNGAWSIAIVIVSQLPASDSSSRRLELDSIVRHLAEGDVDGGVDLTGVEGVDESGGVGEVDDLHLVEVRQALAPVVGVLHVDALGSRREALQHVRPGADLVGRVAGEPLVPDRDDRGGVLGEAVEERHRRLLELDLDRPVVDLGQAAGVEQLDERRRQPELGVEQALERVDDVVGGDRLAVVELDALLEPDDVEVGGLGLDLLGEAVLVGDVEVGVVVDERLPAGDRGGPGRAW